MKISELKDRQIPVVYGPHDDPTRYSVNLYDEFLNRIPMGTLSPLDIEVSISIHYPGSPYLKTDRTEMPPHYACMGSACAHFSCMDKTATVAVAHFQDTKDVHHQTWLYWSDFEGVKDACRNVPGHQMDPTKDIALNISLGDRELRTTIPKLKRR